MAERTKALEAAADVAAILRSRNPIVWIVTREEPRVERYLLEAAAAAGYVARTWDVAQGFATAAGEPIVIEGLDSETSSDPKNALNAIRRRAENGNERVVWIMRDLPVWIQGQIGAQQQRQLRNLARYLPGVKRESSQAIIIVSPVRDVPAELANHTTVIEWPLPDRAEIATILDAAVSVLPTRQQIANMITEVEDEIADLRKRARSEDGNKEEIEKRIAERQEEIVTLGKRVTLEDAAPEEVRDAAIDAAVGLSGEEAEACYARSLVQLKRIDPETISREKKRIIAREGLLQWIDPLPGGLDAVGGLSNFKAWVVQRGNAHTKDAREYGLPAPRGALAVGPPGTGKSLMAKAGATAWKVPLLRLDLGSLKSKYMGESEGNIRKALQVIDTIDLCWVWVDEIEKALAGATQSVGGDGGVAADALGTLLSWMQERKSRAFVFATANDISALPPELLRKGRFDEKWFVDVPTTAERIEILKTALRAHGRGNVEIDHAAVASKTKNFTGAEIAALVPDALFAAFEDGKREITTSDLLAAAENVTPVVKVSAEKIDALRQWAALNARRANAEEATPKPEEAPKPNGARLGERVLEI